MAELDTEEFILNMGPQHPSTHGVIRFILKTDGEVIYDVKPDIGFLHRGLEKIAEKVIYPNFMPYTDRIDYAAAMNCNLGYALTVEKVTGIEVPQRAEYIRVIVAELNRILSHLLMVGSTSLDMGAFTPQLHAIRERERMNDLMEMLCGARLTYNFIRIGGVSMDLPEGFLEKLTEFLDYLEPKLVDFNNLISYNKIFVNRLVNVGVMTRDVALSYGIVGPNLRSCGVKWDLRRDEPYSIYPELDFDVPVGDDSPGMPGDCYTRYMLRIWEMEESVKILRQCIQQIPDGEIRTRIKKKFMPPEGEIYVRTEAPRGELGFYLVSNGEERPYRLRIRTGSFSSLSAIHELARGAMIADLVAIIASLDVVAPEIDR